MVVVIKLSTLLFAVFALSYAVFALLFAVLARLIAPPSAEPLINVYIPPTKPPTPTIASICPSIIPIAPVCVETTPFVSVNCNS